MPTGRAMGSHHKPNKGVTDTWLTPLDVIRKFNDYGTHFDLDPCAFPGHQTADRLICEPENGLAAEWKGRVWLNPPYSNVQEWLEKLERHGNGIALVFARTETKWAQWALQRARAVLLPAGRFTFLKPDGSKPVGNAGAPSMFLSFGFTPNWPFPGIPFEPKDFYYPHPRGDC